MTLFADRITMEEKVIALESDMANLKERARGLGCVLTEMRERYPLLNEMVSQLIERDARITLRDVCIAMERRICVQAAGSKARAKNGLFNFEKIQESADMEAKGSLEAIMENLNLSEDTVEFWGDSARKAANNAHGSLTPSAIREILAQDESDEIDTQQHDAFVAALCKLEMVLEDGTVDATRA